MLFSLLMTESLAPSSMVLTEKWHKVGEKK